MGHVAIRRNVRIRSTVNKNVKIGTGFVNNGQSGGLIAKRGGGNIKYYYRYDKHTKYRHIFLRFHLTDLP